MIHDFKEEYLDLPLEDYILTFDDGLVSPLKYWQELKVLPTEIIFFIPTAAVDNGIEGRPSMDFFDLTDIQYLSSHSNVTIGGHSHAHRRLDTHSNFIEAVNFIHDDTERMCDWFRDNLGYPPTHFCYPYNECNGVYESILKVQFGIQFIYGAERKDIDEL
jgi:peptidoglycan/xylan/chitin deacetylase (PgdA/CDA1 family)